MDSIDEHEIARKRLEAQEDYQKKFEEQENELFNLKQQMITQQQMHEKEIQAVFDGLIAEKMAKQELQEQVISLKSMKDKLQKDVQLARESLTKSELEQIDSSSEQIQNLSLKEKHQENERIMDRRLKALIMVQAKVEKNVENEEIREKALQMREDMLFRNEEELKKREKEVTQESAELQEQMSEIGEEIKEEDLAAEENILAIKKIVLSAIEKDLEERERCIVREKAESEEKLKKAMTKEELVNIEKDNVCNSCSLWENQRLAIISEFEKQVEEVQFNLTNALASTNKSLQEESNNVIGSNEALINLLKRRNKKQEDLQLTDRPH